MSSQSSGEGEIRKAIVEADLVDCMVALPGQLFYSTQIPVCLWFLARDKRPRRLDTAAGRLDTPRSSSDPKDRIETPRHSATRRDRPSTSLRDRRNEVLFIDARKMGTMVDRAHRELTQEDIEKIAGTYHAWRGDVASIHPPGHRVAERIEMRAGTRPPTKYADVPGFCKSATLDEIRSHNYVLTPGRYVGAEDVEEDDEPFEDKMRQLTQQLYAQMAEGEKLDAEIKKNLRELGFV